MSEGRRPDAPSLDELLRALGGCPPAERIELREPVLTFGAACIGPLGDLAGRSPDLTASIASWLEVLAKRDTETRPAVVKALAILTAGPDGRIAQGALERLGAPTGAGGSRKAGATRARGPSAAQEAVHARIIQAARDGRTITYGELETNRGHVGKFLLNISLAEAELGRPPLTSLVVSATDHRPGDGFMPAMVEVGYAHPGETLEDVWERAVRDVHAYWATTDEEGGSQQGTGPP